MGNGRFCYTADITGIQTRRAEYESGIPLSTMAEWGWNSHPNTTQAHPEEATNYVQTGDREVPCLVNQDADAANWLRANPHQSSLGCVGFVTGDGRSVSSDTIQPRGGACSLLNQLYSVEAMHMSTILWARLKAQ